MTFNPVSRTLSVMAALLIAAPVLADQSVGGLPDEGGGSVKGAVKFEGRKIDPKPITTMAGDPKCAAFWQKKGEQPKFETWQWGKNDTLQNVFVYVVKGLEGKTFQPPKDAAKMNQQGCVYEPHVVGVMKDQKLEIKNSDPTLHNLHALPETNEEFNVGQPIQGSVYTHKFDKAEENIFLKCDVHSWMSARIHVVPHPYYAVTGENGTFEIKGLPAGKYTLKFVHEFRRFAPDQETVEVTVEDGKAAEVTVTYAPVKRN